MKSTVRAKPRRKKGQKEPAVLGEVGKKQLRKLRQRKLQHLRQLNQKQQNSNPANDCMFQISRHLFTGMPFLCTVGQPIQPDGCTDVNKFNVG